MHTPDPARRMVGLETEFGISAPGCAMNPMQLSARSVAAYAPFSRAGRWSQAVRWDYEDEDPLADLRGGRLARDLADASLLTDLPGSLAPSAPASASDGSQPGFASRHQSPGLKRRPQRAQRAQRARDNQRYPLAGCHRWRSQGR